MPQLVRGGKYAYGRSGVSNQGKIVIPYEATAEYSFLNYGKVVLLPGSKRSGGFSVTSVELLANQSFLPFWLRILNSQSFRQLRVQLLRLEEKPIVGSR